MNPPDSPFPLTLERGLAVARRLLGLTASRPLAVAEGDPARRTLMLHLTPMGWQCRLVTAEENDAVAWTTSQWETDARKGLTQAVRELLLRHGQGLLESADAIAILLEGPGMAYSDGKTRFLTAPVLTPAAIRLLGAGLLNVPEVTYGAIPLPGTPDERALLAFAGAADLRGLLSQFDKIGLKIQEVTPMPLLLVHRALELGGAVHGGLCLGERESVMVLVNVALGNLTVRALPVGVATLAQALAAGNDISLVEAFQALADQDLLTGIRLEETGSDHAGFHEQALTPPLRQLLSGVRETMEFFAIHRGSGMPTSLEVLGDPRRLVGLLPWLCQHLDLPVQAVSPLELYSRLSHPVAGNLLQGAAQSLLSVGKTKYYYSRQGFVRTIAPPVQSPQPLAMEDGLVPEPPQPAWRGFLNRLGLRAPPSEKPTFEDTPPSRRPNLIQTMGGIAALLMMVWAHGQYRALQVKYHNNIKTYLTESAENDQFLRTVGGKGQDGTGAGNAILWSEKFLAITRHLGPHIWLTALDVDRARETAHKLTIKGQVAPAAGGAMPQVTAFMDRLAQDKAGFMKGFRTLVFKGAEEVKGPQGMLLRFTLEAWVDENPRTEGVVSGSSAAKGSS